MRDFDFLIGLLMTCGLCGLFWWLTFCMVREWIIDPNARKRDFEDFRQQPFENITALLLFACMLVFTTGLVLSVFGVEPELGNTGYSIWFTAICLVALIGLLRFVVGLALGRRGRK